MNKRNVLVCGATGFIGGNIAQRLSLRNDLNVFGTYFKTKPDGELSKNKKLTLIRADLTKKSDVNRVVSGHDIIIQAAAVTSGSKDIVTKPYIHVTDNAIMNSLILRSAYEKKVKHVVFFSCTTMYPDQSKPVREEDFNHKITDKYFGVGWTKVYIEKMCEFFSRISTTKYTAIRHSNIYGPFDKYDLEHSHVFGATVTKVMKNKDGKLTVWGDGSEKRDLLYISDLVDFVEIILKRQQKKFELVNVGFGSSISVLDLVKTIIKASGKNIKVRFDASKPSIKFNLALNTNKAKKSYYWQPKISLEQGIKNTLEWYKNYEFL